MQSAARLQRDLSYKLNKQARPVRLPPLLPARALVNGVSCNTNKAILRIKKTRRVVILVNAGVRPFSKAPDSGFRGALPRPGQRRTRRCEPGLAKRGASSFRAARSAPR